MDDLRQRIRYLIGHGGMWDDPIADVRRMSRIAAAAVGGFALILHLIELLR